MGKNVAHQIVELLEKANIKRVYAVTGDSLNFFNIAVKQSDKIDWVHVRHEEVGAYAATAESELAGIGCCAGSSGPGHVHLINGVYEAHKSRTPLLVIASTIPTIEFGTDYFQETNTIKLFDDCSCYNQMITRPEQVPRMVHTAIQNAIFKKDVAVIGLPGDIAEMDAVEDNYTNNFFFNKPIIIPNKNELQQAAQLINEAKKITLFCGIGASEANAEVVELSKHLNAPVGYSFKGKMSIQPNNPNEVGMTGLLGQPSAYHAMHKSDLIFLIGTDFPYKDFIPTDKKIIQLDAEGSKLGRRAKIDLGLVGNAKETIHELLPLMNQKEDRDFLDSQLELYKKVLENKMTYVHEKGKENAIQPEYAAYLLDELATKDAIFTVDTGMCCVWGARYITGTGDRKMLGSFNHGSMANAMPQAIGAQNTYPDRQVVAMCGDGGLSMLLGDLATIKQYKLPVKIIVFNNRTLGMVKLEMEVAGLPDNETNMENPDFAMIGKAMGIESENIHNPDDLPDAIGRAFSHNGPYLLSVFTNPNALAMPPKVDIDQMLGMTKSMAKLMLGGKMDEVMDTIKSNYKHLKDL
ncbi:pyruvate dehydrogenase (quinone) [Algoriella xinjiangensis]|uniref:Pyruvate dehydrogenase (Quinone) n=1 Tax=Algoriella xinjiangensis TaxID=684065 RepID=A0A1I4ZBP4_9FLAO|nr:thiamine pyrophosphate-dependent enzyme [Algoriella xinjiangensis]SFN47675.1 pyruvate dehydrogenase (quinone) [Algoriella xinjiangensis]VDH17483.1 Pyruvate dehydrogenase [ubiquinone] [Algoriella xinjiangensis]